MQTRTKLIESHPIEKKMGILYYATNGEGIGGKIRENVKDFIVEEILPDKRIIKIDDDNFTLGNSEPGLFTEFILVKRNIESHSALFKIVSALGKSFNDISIAGTKDKMAFTAQRATIWKVPPEKLLELQIKGITIKSPRTTIYKTYLGDHKGNHFTIKIRNIVDKDKKINKKIKKILQEIDEFNGVPNFFGHQRFGTRRPISHEIGRFVLLGNLEEAIRLYLTFISDDESEIVKNARRTYLETNDYNETIKILPKSMIFEKMILEYLALHPTDFSGAFHILPKNLQRMFIHSYQSYIWNKTLSERMKMYGNLQPQPIDLKENEQIVLPIIGYKTELEDNEISDYIKKLLEQEEMKLEYFKVNSIPSLKFMGSNRIMSIKPKDFSFEIQKDEKNQNLVETEFSLKTGSYATIILREFMKTTPLNF